MFNLILTLLPPNVKNYFYELCIKNNIIRIVVSYCCTRFDGTVLFALMKTNAKG